MFGWLTDRFRRAPTMRPPEEQLAHLDAVAETFTDCELPLEDPHYWNWKISCSSGLFQPPVVTPEIETRAVRSLLRGAANLAGNQGGVDLPYFRAATVLIEDDLFASEVTAFYDRDYYQRFWSGEPALPVSRFTERFDVELPDGFDAHGVLIRQEMDEEEADLPGVYRGEDGRYWSDYSRWVIGQRP